MKVASKSEIGSRTAPATALRKAGWLSRTPAEFQRAVLERGRVRRLGRNGVVYSVGDPVEGRASGLWGVVSGGIALEIAPGERGPTFAHFARPGFWFGASAVLTRHARMMTAVATRPTTLVTLTTAQFEQIAAQMPLAWRWLGLLAVEHLRLSLTAMDDLMIRNPTDRAVAVLLRLAGHRGGFPDCKPTCEVDVSQEGLAVMANLSRSTVGVILRSLEKVGLLEVRYRLIRLLDPKRLAQFISDDEDACLPTPAAIAARLAFARGAEPRPVRRTPPPQ
jgi:CRP/FNR family transcriptional regulator, cyclic AMP receptor protein